MAPRTHELITATEAAARRGCAVSTATRAMATVLAQAVTEGKLDASHPLARKWLSKRPQRGPRSGHSASDTPTDSGSESLTVRKKRVEVALLETKLARDEGRLVARALVHHHVFGLLNATFKRLIADFPTTAASRLASAVRAGVSKEEQVGLLRSMLSAELRSIKHRTTRALRHCESTGQLDPCPTPKEGGSSREEIRLRAFADALRAALSSSVGPRIVELTAKAIAREACGASWAPAVFDEAMQITDHVRDDATHAVSAMMAAAVADSLNAALAAPEKEDSLDPIH